MGIGSQFEMKIQCESELSAIIMAFEEGDPSALDLLDNMPEMERLLDW